jgi:hypothetical protein
MKDFAAMLTSVAIVLILVGGAVAMAALGHWLFAGALVLAVFSLRIRTK